MSPEAILQRAKETIEYRQNYGEFEVTAFRTAAILEKTLDEPYTPEKWLLTMVGTKLARIANDSENLDHYLDAICYLAQLAAFVDKDWEF